MSAQTHSLPLHEIVIAAVVGVFYVFILIAGRRKPKLWAELRFFYYFIIWNLSTLTAAWTWYFLFPESLNGWAYSHVWSLLRIVGPLLQVFVLWRLYSAFRFHNDRLIWHSLLLATVAMVLFLASVQDMAGYGVYFLVQAGLLQFQVLFCALILGYIALNNDLMVGWNHVALIFGLVISIGVDYIGLVLFMAGVISYPEWRPWIAPLDALPAVIWAIALRGYHPTGSKPISEMAAIAEKDREFEKAVRSLLQR